MIQYGEQFGWHHFIRLARAFRADLQPRFRFHLDGVSTIERSAYIVAALSVAFGRDFRGDFIALNFPIDNGLYGEIVQQLLVS
jgi:hypothetical protein